MNGDKIKRPEKKGGPDRCGIPRGHVRNREAFEVNKKSVADVERPSQICTPRFFTGRHWRGTSYNFQTKD